MAIADGAIVVTARVTPAPGNTSDAHHAGAFAVVFTTAKTEEEAIEISAREIADAGWLWQSLESIAHVTRASYDEGNPGLEHFEQALLDGVVVVLHTYAQPHDEDPRH